MKFTNKSKMVMGRIFLWKANFLKEVLFEVLE